MQNSVSHERTMWLYCFVDLMNILAFAMHSDSNEKPSYSSAKETSKTSSLSQRSHLII